MQSKICVLQVIPNLDVSGASQGCVDVANFLSTLIEQVCPVQVGDVRLILLPEKQIPSVRNRPDELTSFQFQT